VGKDKEKDEEYSSEKEQRRPLPKEGEE